MLDILTTRMFSLVLALLPAAAFAVGELPEGATVIVPPLLRAEWNQGRHYNLMCPYAPGYNCPDDRMYAGCVAVAAGMILDYYRWPVQGNTVGLNLENEKYWTKSDVCLRARFDEPYDWEAIRESYGHVVSARSSLYYYANFLSNGRNWMGDEDLTCDDDAALVKSVADVKRCIDGYDRRARLQYCFMNEHEELCAGVYRTTYSDGTKVYVNYTDKEISLDGVNLPAQDWFME